MSNLKEHTKEYKYQCAFCGETIQEDSAVALTWSETDTPDESQSAMAHKSCFGSVLHLSAPNNLMTNVFGNSMLNQKVTLQDGFWITWYYLKQIFDYTGGKFDLSDVLSASEPFFQANQPADSAMTEYWMEAYKKFLQEGIPPVKKLK